jgi:hypothetical protein
VEDREAVRKCESRQRDRRDEGQEEEDERGRERKREHEIGRGGERDEAQTS